MSNASLTSTARATRAAMVRFDTIDPAALDVGFATLRELGFDAVDLPLVWSKHETSAGRFDFDARERGARSIHGAIDAARRAGLAVRVRLGPRCVEGEPGFGVPRTVIDDPAVIARNARRGAVIEPISLTPTAAPSFASRVFIDRCAAWIRAATRAVGESGFDRIDSLTVGAGTFAPLRDPIDEDRHPDAGPVPAERAERAERADRIALAWYEALANAALESGAPEDKLRCSLIGPRTAAPAAHSIAARFPVDCALPFTSVGSEALWAEVSDAVATSAHGARFDVQCGSSPFARPLRNRDAAAVARVAIAAGASEIVLRYAWCGEGWVGSLLDPKGVAQRVAQRWRALFDECSAIAPTVHEGDATPVARPSGWLSPISRGWLAQFGLLDHHEVRGDQTLSELELECDVSRAVLARRSDGQLVLLSTTMTPATVRDPRQRWIPGGEHTMQPGAVAVFHRREDRAS